MSDNLLAQSLKCMAFALILILSGCNGSSTSDYEVAEPGISISQSLANDSGVYLKKNGIVLDTGSTGAFDASRAESPAIWYDPSQSLYGMVYTGYDSANRGTLGIAWSPDMRTWTKGGQLLANTGVSGDPDAGGLTGGYMVLENDTYYLFYIGLTSAGYEAGTKTLCLATATNIAGPWTRHGVVIGLGSTANASAWRAGAIYHASIINQNGMNYLFFNAADANARETIGYAKAPSLLGPWEVDDAHSPILQEGPAHTWDSNRIGDPSVFRVDGTWAMAFYGTNAGDASAGDGLAFTSDAEFPLGWKKYEGNPVLKPGPSAFDSLYAAKPFITYNIATQYHFYTAVSGSGHRAIAMAESTAQK